jgi:hypothetical protein
MRRLSLFLFVVLFAGQALCADLPGEWQGFERAVRDGRLSREQGQRALEAWERRLREAFPESGGAQPVCFPLSGYGLRDVGGRAGEGYLPQGYDFLDGNRHRGHPAQDIFIHDLDRDGLEDGRERPVAVLALSGGVVLSVFREWREAGEAGEIRGGNYVWLYHPTLRVFSYYAHLGEIFAGVGERVECGERLGNLGRTGKRARPPGSPTHLHLMVLRVEGMKPVDPYPVLRERSWQALEK